MAANLVQNPVDGIDGSFPEQRGQVCANVPGRHSGHLPHVKPSRNVEADAEYVQDGLASVHVRNSDRYFTEEKRIFKISNQTRKYTHTLNKKQEDAKRRSIHHRRLFQPILLTSQIFRLFWGPDQEHPVCWWHRWRPPGSPFRCSSSWVRPCKPKVGRQYDFPYLGQKDILFFVCCRYSMAWNEEIIISLYNFIEASQSGLNWKQLFQTFITTCHKNFKYSSRFSQLLF